MTQSTMRLANGNSDFIRVMQVLEAGVTVEMIMSYPVHCLREDEPVSTVLDSPEFAPFDCFPVKSESNGQIFTIGAIYRNEIISPAQTASEAMRPLHEVAMVGSRDSVDRLMRTMHETGDRHFLVLHDAQLTGIVTRSDLDRMPVRLLILTRIIHAEQLMTHLVRERISDEQEWFRKLPKCRQTAIMAIQQQNREAGDDLDLLECTHLADKLKIIAQSLGMSNVKKKLDSMENLRNRVMHARSAEDSDETLASTLTRVSRLDSAIETLSEAIESTKVQSV